MKQVFGIFGFILICFLIIWRCSSSSEPNPTNNPPIISNITTNPDSVEVNRTCELSCNASDPDGDNLNYTWEASAGIVNGPGANVTWTAPNSGGTYSVSCNVDDGNGGVDSASINIVVQEDQIPTDGLVAYYPFNGNANDESGNGYNGTVYGNSVQFVPGLFDQAIKFDNSNSGTFTVNDYVHLPNITINEITVSHWVKFLSGSSTSYDGCTYSIGVFPSKQFFVRVRNDGQIRGYIIINRSSSITDLVNISDKQWHFIAVTVDSDYMRIYMDGSIIDSTGIPSMLDFTDAFQDIALHRFNNDKSSRFTGELDDLYIFNRALSDTEILQIYNKK